MNGRTQNREAKNGRGAVAHPGGGGTPGAKGARQRRDLRAAKPVASVTGSADWVRKRGGMRGIWTALAPTFLALASQSLALGLPGVPAIATNEWPDPNFFIQDANGTAASINDTLTGAMPPTVVTGYSVGSRVVTVYTRSTSGLLVGQYLSFAPPCDRALTATLLQIQSIVPNTSFKVTLEYPSGVPSVSATCPASLVQHGDVSGKGGGQVTSNVMRFANGTLWPSFWISSRPAHVHLFNSGANVLIVRKVTAGPEFVYWNARDPGTRAGTRRSFGAAIYVANGAGASARAYINNGALVLGRETATAPARTWLSVQNDVPSTATTYQEGVALYGPVDSTFAIGEFESAPYPTALPDGSFSTPRAQTILSLASISPYVGVAFALPSRGGFDVNLGQASNLQITGGVTYMIGNLEGECTTFPAALSVASPESPTVYGPIVHQLADTRGQMGNPLYYGFASGEWPVRNNHLLMYGTANTTWKFVSWDIQGFTLLAGP